VSTREEGTRHVASTARRKQPAGRGARLADEDAKLADEAEAVPVVDEELFVGKTEVGGGGDGGEEEARAVLRGLRDAALNVEG